MGLFQKKPQTSSPPLYSLGLQRHIILVGLGNVGKQYEGTRHNIGFDVLDELASSQEFDPWIEKKDLKCHLTTKNMGSSRVILVKPTTMMNLSGEAVLAAAQFYKVGAQNIVAVYDELDIDFGQIRTRVGGSAAGHNGVKSVSHLIGEEYGRIRIGIGPKTPEQIDSADFVLARFTSEQEAQKKALLKEANAILTEFIYGTDLQSETRSFIV